MVAAARSAASTVTTSARKNPSPLRDPPRPPLIPSEKDNAVVSRRPRNVSSRYLSYSTPSSTSTSTSTSSSSSTTSSGSGGRRYQSPLFTPCPSTPPALPPQSAAQRRSHSVGRARPDPAPAPAEPQSTAARAISTTTTTTRSLSVSFQGESFFYQTSKTKPTPERRRATTPVKPARPSPTPTPTPDHSENSRPFERWPAARPRQSNPLNRSLDCSAEKKEPILATVRLLQQTMVFEDRTRRASFDASDLSASSDTESVSSGSNSGGTELSVPPRARPAARGICVPARFWQETNSRLRGPPEPGTPLPSRTAAAAATPTPKPASVKKSLVDSPVSSPRSVSSPLRGPIRHSSPSKLADTRPRGMASPSRVRSGLASAALASQPGNAPSIISFAAEVRRAKKGENRIEEAHMLRLLHNRHLQWRFMNARASAALMSQRMAVEKYLYNACMTTSGMCDSVTIKRIKLHLLTQNLKLTSILKWQMTYLEEWSLMERDHSSSLSEAIEALEASTLRLPVAGGARADLLEVKDAVGSAVDVMQAMGSSICSLLSKVEGTSSLVSELAKVASHERALLDQSRELLSKVATMHVMQSSLRGHILQLKHRPSEMHL